MPRTNLAKRPKLARGLYRRLPWYGKLLVPLMAIASGLRLLVWAASLFG